MPARNVLFKRSSSFSSEDSGRSDEVKPRKPRGRHFHRTRGGRKSRSNSRSSDVSSEESHVEEDKPLPPPILVYHESARDIVFRDHLRRATISRATSTVSNSNSPKNNTTSTSVDNNSNHSQVVIANFQPVIQPLPPLKLGPQDRFKELEESSYLPSDDWTDAEREVVQMLKEQRAVVKTIRNADWTSFMHRFRTPQETRRGYHGSHVDIPPKNKVFRFNSFVTSTTLLPEYGKKMRCYGSTKEYTTGVVFALPTSWGGETEDEAQRRTQTWSWPVGYSAKTEFNIDRQGNLINGRQEALVPLSGLRRNNYAYVHDKDYEILGRMVKGGLKTVPFNEVYVRVGGLGLIVNGIDKATGEEQSDEKGTGRSFDKGIGLPVALFVRTAFYGNLISLLRTRARIASNGGEKNIEGMPLLLITPELGVRVLTERLQQQLLKVASRSLNPFQNPNVAWKTTLENTSERHLQQKTEELINLDSDAIKQTLTPEERARLAGGFGATDDSVANLLMEALQRDKSHHGSDTSDDKEQHQLQDVVNEGLAAAVRSGDYHTSRQLLILYSLIASRANELDDGTDPNGNDRETNHEDEEPLTVSEMRRAGEELRQSLLSSEKEILEMEADVLEREADEDEHLLSKPLFAPPPPPPPLDTDRLRSATNSDGLLAVLGAAQVLKAVQDGSAKRRAEEAVDAIEEWVEHGEQSVAFRLKSWNDQRAAQSDLKIAMEDDSNFLAFVSNKAISNRKNFAKDLKESVAATDFQSIDFLRGIHEMVSKMHSPCLRLELLQYILGLDNRYSVAHLARSVELAATCLSISQTDDGAKPHGLLMRKETI